MDGIVSSDLQNSVLKMYGEELNKANRSREAMCENT